MFDAEFFLQYSVQHHSINTKGDIDTTTSL